MLPVFVLLIALLVVLAPVLWRAAVVTPAEIAEQKPALEPVPTPTPPDWPLEVALIFTPEVQYWREDIVRWSLLYGVPPNLIATLMQIESCGNPNIQSSVGATGLFQVMPFHFAEGENPADPNTNAMRGLTYFATGLAIADGDLGRAFAGYNGGHGIIHNLPTYWPQETQYYQYWGGGIYTDAESGLLESPTLRAWLESGGANLCALAAVELGLEGE
jgi:soluble lytic murein transglycosylase-like protein